MPFSALPPSTPAPPPSLSNSFVASGAAGAMLELHDRGVSAHAHRVAAGGKVLWGAGKGREGGGGMGGGALRGGGHQSRSQGRDVHCYVPMDAGIAPPS